MRSWWPEVLAAVLGLVLLAHRGGVVTLEDAAEVFLRLVFVMALAAVVIGDTMRFITWWFWTRQQP